MRIYIAHGVIFNIGPATAAPAGPAPMAMYITCHFIESVDSINWDERGFPLMQYITNWGISRARNTITHFKHHHRVLRLLSNRMSVVHNIAIIAQFTCAPREVKNRHLAFFL